MAIADAAEQPEHAVQRGELAELAGVYASASTLPPSAAACVDEQRDDLSVELVARTAFDGARADALAALAFTFRHAEPVPMSLRGRLVQARRLDDDFAVLLRFPWDVVGPWLRLRVARSVVPDLEAFVGQELILTYREGRILHARTRDDSYLRVGDPWRRW